MRDLTRAAAGLRRALAGLEFPAPVTHVYNPLDYAWEAHAEYLGRFGAGGKRVLFLGMNPGPFGMAQTGVPFGEVAAVRDWMGISAEVGRPDPEHPKRPVQGFGCPRSEVSGRRLWGLFAQRFGQPERFFAEHFVANFCPLVWMQESGANLTPDKIPARAMEAVGAACQTHLLQVVEILSPHYLIGIGAYAEKQLASVADVVSSKVTVGRVLHPSPASPAANRNWAGTVTRQLVELGVWQD